MAISGPASYLATLDEFLAHWEVADGNLGVGHEVTLPNGVQRAALQTLRTSLETKRTLVRAKLTLQNLARGDIEDKKSILHLRINQFKEKVQSQHGGTKWERALPNVPGITEGPDNFTTPLEEANSLWELMNADASIADVVLLGGYTQTNFAADLEALKAAYPAFTKAEKVVEITREDRNDLQDAIYTILLNYRKELPTNFDKNHALVDSLPRLTPEPGSTPDPVVATATWDAAQGMARITFTASTDPNLLHYEIRSCVGPNYSTDNESAAGSVAANALHEFLTPSDLTAPGSTVSYKVYVVTTTGNEKGSNTAVVTRP